MDVYIHLYNTVLSTTSEYIFTVNSLHRPKADGTGEHSPLIKH